MKICVTQKEGTRYFSKFANISERDKLEVELLIVDKNNKLVVIDLTSALIEEYAKHPEVGRVDPEAMILAAATRPSKPLVIKKIKAVSPAYLTESKKEKDDMIAKVREAQYKAAEEMKQKKAVLAAARAERLAGARKIKAEKEEAERKKSIKKAKITAKETTLAKPKTAKATVSPTPKLSKKASIVVAEVKKTVVKKTAAKVSVKASAKPAKIEKVKTPVKTAGAKAVKPKVMAEKKIEKIVKLDTAPKKLSKPEQPKNTSKQGQFLLESSVPTVQVGKITKPKTVATRTKLAAAAK